MIKNVLKRGDVIQIGPEVPNASLRGCFVIVEEMTTDEQIKGYIVAPGHQDSIRVTTTIAGFDHVEYVGVAAYENEQEWVKN